jgi:hypothetical protein
MTLPLSHSYGASAQPQERDTGLFRIRRCAEEEEEEERGVVMAATTGYYPIMQGEDMQDDSEPVV